MENQHNAIGEYSPNSEKWRGITLTISAAKRIQFLSSNGQILRLSTKISGCTGYTYVLEQREDPEEGDLAFESCGGTLFVPVSSMPLLDGTKVDYVRNGLNEIFVYHNPNVKNECGCGESFGV